VVQGSKCPRLLSELPTRLSTELFAAVELARLPAGRVLFRAGDSCDGCYRVEDGLLKVTIVSGSGAERILAFLGSGAIVGELSIIDGLPRSATVMAVRDATLSFLLLPSSHVVVRMHAHLSSRIAEPRTQGSHLRQPRCAVSLLELRDRRQRNDLTIEAAGHIHNLIGAFSLPAVLLASLLAN
jgi:CRP-like cAMP-binding protein